LGEYLDSFKVLLRAREAEDESELMLKWSPPKPNLHECIEDVTASKFFFVREKQRLLNHERWMESGPAANTLRASGGRVTAIGNHRAR